MNFEHINIEKIAKAIEDDEGFQIDGLRESLAEAKRGEYAAVYTPEVLMARQRGRPVGTVKADKKRQTALRLNVTTLERWRASGRGWQTRAAALLDRYAPMPVLGVVPA
jgi:uncharacterized protein (DUF4415 family)